jgi:dipeptidase D
MLQGHLDMVCEKNRGTEHDFSTDPIRLVTDGDWLKADGTTLGADNGIAVAMALAVLESDTIEHGPLEALFTVDEESGLTGAMGLDPSIVEGRLLLNLDTEEEGAFYIGCAGGVNTEGFIPVATEAVPSGRKAFTLAIGGFQGGHSGADIHLGFGNALVSCGRILRELAGTAEIGLVSVDGGGKHNAIPRECTAVITVPEEKSGDAKKLCDGLTAEIRAEIGDIEPGFTLSMEESPLPEEQLDAESSRRILRLMRIMPHGVAAMSRAIEGLVETSSNFAAIETQKGCCSTLIRVLTSQRSSVMSALDDIAARVDAAIEIAGGQKRSFSRYPAWTPNPGNSLLARCKAVYREVTGKEATEAAIHAGLECGVIGDKIEGMEMISFGPQLLGVHTPEEKLNIPSVERTWTFFLELLKAL